PRLVAAQIARQLAGVGIASRGRGRRRLSDDRLELGRQVLRACEVDRLALGEPGEHHLRAADVRRLTGERLEQYAAERVDVAARIGWLAARLLGRHEAGCADNRTRDRRGVVRNLADAR